MVDETSCHLTGAIDSAGAEIRPFGQNPYSLQALTGTVHLMTGWRRLMITALYTTSFAVRFKTRW